MSRYGACSSMAEHQIVDLDVAGSSPVKRPICTASGEIQGPFLLVGVGWWCWVVSH
jgi:hypothetical protein